MNKKTHFFFFFFWQIEQKNLLFIHIWHINMCVCFSRTVQNQNSNPVVFFSSRHTVSSDISHRTRYIGPGSIRPHRAILLSRRFPYIDHWKRITNQCNNHRSVGFFENKTEEHIFKNTQRDSRTSAEFFWAVWRKVYTIVFAPFIHAGNDTILLSGNTHLGPKLKVNIDIIVVIYYGKFNNIRI